MWSLVAAIPLLVGVNLAGEDRQCAVALTTSTNAREINKLVQLRILAVASCIVNLFHDAGNLCDVLVAWIHYTGHDSGPLAKFCEVLLESHNGIVRRFACLYALH